MIIPISHIREVRQGEVKKLLKITQLVNGNTGSLTAKGGV